MTRPRLIVILLLVAVLAVHGRVVTHEFTEWDDADTIHHNPRLNPPSLANLLWYWNHAEAGLYVPVTYTVWAALATIAQLDSPDEHGIRLNPWVFHAASVLAHALATLAIFALLRRLISADWPAMAGAILFALHPVQVESVAWASGLKDVLAGMFGAVALWQYAVFTQSDQPRQRLASYLVALLAFTLALLSKPSAVVLPLMAAVLDLLILRRSLRQTATSLVPWLLLSATIAIVAKLVQPAEGVPVTPRWTRPLIAGDSLAFYLYKLTIPIRLAVDYGRRPQSVMATQWVWFAWTIPALVALLLWRFRSRQPTLAAAGLLFLVALLPILGFLPFLFQYYSTVADHYLYLAMLGPALALASLLATFPSKNLSLASAVLLAALGTLSIIQGTHWQNELTLWQHTVNVTPHSFAGHNSLGRALIRANRSDEAGKHFRISAALKPDHAPAHENLANFYALRGDAESAITHFKRYIEIISQRPASRRPNLAPQHELLGQILLSRGRPDEAALHFQEAQRLRGTQTPATREAP